MTDNVGLAAQKLFDWNPGTFNIDGTPGDAWGKAISTLSLGESDYIMVPIFG
jgi:hypothetical protein